MALAPDRYLLGRSKHEDFLARLEQMLEDLSGVAILAHAKIPLVELPSRERDSAADVPSMARTDNAWGIGFIAALEYGLINAGMHGIGASRVCIFHDARNLKTHHVVALEASFDTALNTEIRWANEVGLLPSDFSPSIERFRFVPKTTSGGASSSSQAGVALVDRLLRAESELIGRGKSERIWPVDVSNTVRDFLGHFAQRRQDATGDV